MKSADKFTPFKIIPQPRSHAELRVSISIMEHSR